MTRFFTLIGLILLALPGTAQVLTKRIVQVNGGQFPPFGEPVTEPANVTLYNPADGSYTSIDTIQVPSIQDLLVDGPFAYLAAQDSIIRYDLTTGTRVASAEFLGVSTVSLALSDDYLLVGNFFLPFGGPSPYTRNLIVYDRETLALVDSVPALSRPVNGIVVQGDTAYVTQNLTNSGFADSAGFLCKVLLSTLEVVDTLEVNDNDENLGKLILQDSVIYGLNGGSNSITTYDTRTGMARTDSLTVSIGGGGYPSRNTIDEQGLLHTVIDGKIATFDLASRTVVQADIVDTVITACVLDTVNDLYYVTQTDFGSYTGGGIYDINGQRIDTLFTGFSPEAIEVAYNHTPVAMDDDASLDLDVSPEVKVAVLDNDSDADARQPLQVAIITPPTAGTATLVGDSIVYDPQVNASGTDSVQYAAIDEWGDQDTAWLFIDVRITTSVTDVQPTQVLVYPNPGQEQMTLRFTQPWYGKVELLDMTGRRLMQKQVSGDSWVRWQTETLPTGTYLLRGINSTDTWQQRWIKQ